MHTGSESAIIRLHKLVKVTLMSSITAKCGNNKVLLN